MGLREDIDALDSRWPTLSRFLKLADRLPREPLSLEDFKALNLQIISDEEGFMILMNIFNRVLSGQIGPEDRKLLIDFGILSAPPKGLQEQIDALENRLASETLSTEEREKLAKEIEAVDAAVRECNANSCVQIAKGLEAFKLMYGDKKPAG